MGIKATDLEMLAAAEKLLSEGQLTLGTLREAVGGGANARLRKAMQRARDEVELARSQQANDAAAIAEKRRQTERHRYLLDGISPKHCRLGRTALELHQRELAERAGVSLLTIIRFEQGAVAPRPSTVRKIKEALESYGLLFLERGIVWPALASPDVS